MNISNFSKKNTKTVSGCASRLPQNYENVSNKAITFFACVILSVRQDYAKKKIEHFVAA